MPGMLAVLLVALVPAGPAPNAPLPSSPAGIARALAATDAALHRAIDAWQASGPAAVDRTTPGEVTLWGLREQRLYRRLRENAALARTTLPLLRQPLRAAARDIVVAGQELLALAADTPPNPHPPQPAPALPAGVLRAFYGEAQRRFAIPWPVLAAVNQVESGYGRLQNTSSAGAQGPMQFLPSTWKRYGLGGDVHDPHDAILGAASYLRANGGRADLRGALHHYNPSTRYVDAVLRYARVIEHDPDAYLALHSWQVYVRTASGARRLTGPGTAVPSTRVASPG
jgi:membrane-bound lytic murein transglycosylase B